MNIPGSSSIEVTEAPNRFAGSFWFHTKWRCVVLVSIKFNIFINFIGIQYIIFHIVRQFSILLDT